MLPGLLVPLGLQVPLVLLGLLELPDPQDLLVLLALPVLLVLQGLQGLLELPAPLELLERWVPKGQLAPQGIPVQQGILVPLAQLVLPVPLVLQVLPAVWPQPLAVPVSSKCVTYSNRLSNCIPPIRSLSAWKAAAMLLDGLEPCCLHQTAIPTPASFS